MFKAIKEFFKEEGRILVLVIISGGITALYDYLAVAPINKTTLAIILGCVTIALKGLDKAIHKYGKAKNSKVLTKGITQF